MTTDETDIDKAMAAAIRELRQHGGSPEQVEAVIAHFKTLRERSRRHRP